MRGLAHGDRRPTGPGAMSRTARLLLPSVCLLAGLLPSAASAALPEFTHAEAKRALADARRALAPEASAAEAARATPALRDLAVALPALDGAAERRAERILARPDDKKDDEYFGKEADGSPICNAQFCVHFSSDKRSAPASDRFLAEVVTALDTTFAVENMELGWRGAEGATAPAAPERRRRRGPDRRLHQQPGQAALRLRGARSGPGGLQALRLPGPRQQLRRVPEPAARVDAGDRRPRVQPHPPVRLRHARGHLAVRGLGDLGRAEGLPATSTTTSNFIPSFAKHPELPLTGKKKVYGDAVLEPLARVALRAGRDRGRVAAVGEDEAEARRRLGGRRRDRGERRSARSAASSLGLRRRRAEWRSLDDFPDSAALSAT